MKKCIASVTRFTSYVMPQKAKASWSAAVCPLKPISRDMISPSWWRDFSDTCHKVGCQSLDRPIDLHWRGMHCDGVASVCLVLSFN